MSLNVYKSSAGSGKTFTLVKEYLKLCYQAKEDYYFASILAITFTNKATAEMKERILKHLKITASNDQEDLMGNIIAEELGVPYAELHTKAKRCVSAILHSYGDFSISTIDRFTSRLVRTFARDLGISLNFKVLLDHEEVMQKAVSSLVDEVGKDELITQLLKSFISQRIEADKSWNVQQSLLKFSKNLISENSFYYLNEIGKLPDSVFEESRIRLQQNIRKFKNEVREIGKLGLDVIEKQSLTKKDFYQSALPNYFNYLAVFKEETIKPNSYVRSTLEQDKWYSSSCTAEAKQAIDLIQEELREYSLKAIDLVESKRETYLSEKGILQNIHNLQLAKLIEQRFVKIKREEQLLHISDFNKKIAEVVLSEPIPFIYERLGDKYQNLMVDEFQDTSILQFINLLPLLDESLSKGQFNMLVGDAKQAIYRFRGGESEQFAQLPNIEHLYQEQATLVAMRLQNIKGHYQEELLAINRRSSFEVIHFNNQFFEFAFHHPKFHSKAKQAFEHVKQEIPSDSKKGEGYVEIQLFDGENQKQQELERVYEIVKQATKDGFLLQDIAILCRWNKQAALTAEFLKSKGIEVLSSEALLIVSSPKVKFLIALLKWCVNPNAEISRLQIIAYLCQYDDEVEHARNIEKYASPSFDLNELIKNKGYIINPEELLKLDLFQFFESLIRTFNLAEAFDVYIQFLQEYTFDYSRQEGNHFTDFIEYWDRNEHKLSLDLSADINAVKILSIHKSKGLEFPITIVPFLDQDVTLNAKNFKWVKTPQELNLTLPFAIITEKKEFLESHFKEELETELIKKQEDLLNDNYVAFTRASERLYLLAPKSKNNVSINFLLASFIKEYGNENFYSTGHERFNTNKNETSAKNNVMHLEYQSSNWQERIRISSDLTAFYGEESTLDAIEYGNLIHEVLAELKGVEMIDKVLKRYLLQGKINVQEKEKIALKLNRLLNAEEVKPYFSSELKSRSEALLIDSLGNKIRPDRIIELKDGTFFILEFKTGKEDASHRKQLQEYMTLLQEIKKKKVAGALLYIEEEKLISMN